jgi:hypothetical protein
MSCVIQMAFQLVKNVTRGLQEPNPTFPLGAAGQYLLVE